MWGSKQRVPACWKDWVGRTSWAGQLLSWLRYRKAPSPRRLILFLGPQAATLPPLPTLNPMHLCVPLCRSLPRAHQPLHRPQPLQVQWPGRQRPPRLRPRAALPRHLSGMAPRWPHSGARRRRCCARCERPPGSLLLRVDHQLWRPGGVGVGGGGPQHSTSCCALPCIHRPGVLTVPQSKRLRHWLRRC